MNILLTGSGGFLGSYLKRYLSDKYTLLTPRSTELDLLDIEAVKTYFINHKIDLIIHSAAYGVRITVDAKKEDVAIPNIKMFENLSLFVSEKCPMLVMGSGAEYDKSKPIINVKESDFGRFVPQDPYGYSKYIISQKIENMDNIINLRIFGIYGFGEHNTRVTTCIIKNNLSCQDIVLNQNVLFSFIFITDFCKIVERFIQKLPKEKFINVVHPQHIEIKRLAEIVNSFGYYNSSIIFKNKGLNKEYTASGALLKQYLTDFNFTSFEYGMMSMYEELKKRNYA